MTTPQRPPRMSHNGPGCKVPCAGGRRCVCVSGVKHQIHCCNDATCECRTKLRESGTGVSK
jgi:hypothetical protein